MIRDGAVRLLGLVVLATSLVGASGAAVANERDTGIRVTAEGVSFDRWQISRGATLEYTVRPLDGDNSSYVRRYLGGSERHSGWAAFHEAPDRYPGGYCVTWVRLDRYDWGEWMNGPACTEPEESATTDAEESGDPPDESPQAEPSSSPKATQGRPPAASTQKPETEPTPSPSAAEPTPEPTPTPSPSPTPGRSASAEPGPVVSSEPNDPASAIIRSFGLPASAGDGERALPQSAGVVWAWVILGGIGAAVGGALLMMFRRG